MKNYLRYLHIVSFGVFVSFFIIAHNVHADGELDPSFDPGTGPNGSISAMAKQSDGKILVAGRFSEYDGVPINGGDEVNRIVRINVDGSLDTTFDSGVGLDNKIHKIFVQSDGKILIGGWFTSYDGMGVDYRARLNTDGSIDTTFEVSNNVNGDGVFDFAVQPDGKIIMVGHFSIVGNDNTDIVRLNTDGTIDASFNPGEVVGDYYYGVRWLILQDDGKIVTGTGDYYPNLMVRLNSDGSQDISFVNNGPNDLVRKAYKQLDGKMIIAGDFTEYNSVPVYHIARINIDGSLDTAFDGGVGIAGNGESVYDIVEQSDGKILIGGDFLSYDGDEVNNIVRLNTDGIRDTSFVTGTGVNSIISGIETQSDGKIVVAGEFTEYDGVSVPYLMRLGADVNNDDDLIEVTSNLNLTISENLTLNCGSSIDLDNGTTLTAGTPQTNTTTCQVTTNDQEGYNLSLTDDRTTSNALYHTTQSTTQDGQIQDKTPWSSTTPNAQPWNGTGLAFGLLSSTATKNESWWGNANNCNDSTQLYAGLPDTDTNFMEHTTYSNTHTDTTICYKLDIPSTQLSGEYTGSVTYTAAGRP